MKGYVVCNTNGQRYRVISRIDSDRPILRLRPFRGPDIQELEANCTPWKRGSMRHLKGTIPHRGRPVHLHIDTATEIIRVKLKGKRAALTVTFGGLFDVLSRQAAMNARREKAFAKRTRRGR